MLQHLCIFYSLDSSFLFRLISQNSQTTGFSLYSTRSIGFPLHLLKAGYISLRMTRFAIYRNWYFKIVKQNSRLKHILRKINVIHIITNFKRGEKTSFSASFFAFPLKSNEIDQTKPMKHKKWKEKSLCC